MSLLKTAIFTVLVPGSVTTLVPWRILRSGMDVRLPLGPARFAGLGLLVPGVLGYLACALAFAVVGKGTPAPIDPPKVFVARGLYRFVRNPMYASVLAVVLGTSMVFESVGVLAWGALLWAFFHSFTVFYEEPNLKARFGAEYEAYLRTVPRWLPRRPRDA